MSSMNTILPALRDIAGKTGVSVKRLQQYWEQAAQQARRSGYTSCNSGFYRYVIGALKRRVGLYEAISEAEVVITMSNDQELQDSRESLLTSAFLDPRITIVKPKDLLAELMSKVGEHVYDEFMSLLVYKTIPVKHKDEIVEFLSGKTDLISLGCLARIHEEAEATV